MLNKTTSTNRRASRSKGNSGDPKLFMRKRLFDLVTRSFLKFSNNNVAASKAAAKEVNHGEQKFVQIDTWNAVA